MIPRDYLTMEDSVLQAKLVALEEETEAIHFATMLYWQCEAQPRSRYGTSGRQKRLSQVRKEYGRTEA